MKKIIARLGAFTASALVLVKPVFAQKEVKIGQPSYGISNLDKLITSGITAAMVIAALVTFFFLVWGGIQWILSGGDKGKYEEARGRITAALIGLAIVAAAWAIMQLVGYFLGIDITKGLNLPSAAGN